MWEFPKHIPPVFPGMSKHLPEYWRSANSPGAERTADECVLQNPDLPWGCYSWSNTQSRDVPHEEGWKLSVLQSGNALCCLHEVCLAFLGV